MFEIEVFSNPLNALVGEGGFLRHAEYAMTTQYDEELIKPALLLADRVCLRSHRIDLLRDEERDLEMTRRLAPVYSQFMHLSAERNARDLAYYGLSDRDLLSSEEVELYRRITDEERALQDRLKLVPMQTNVEAIRAQRAARREQFAPYDEYWASFLDRAAPFVSAARRRLTESIEAFKSDTLEDLTDSGLLSQEPWDPLPKSRPRQIQDNISGPNAEFERAFEAMVNDLAHSRSSVMLDDEVRSSVSALPTASHLGSSLNVAGAVNLVRMVEGISVLPLDEVQDVRKELRDYIAPFRSFVLDVSTGVEWEGIDDAERARLLKLTWEAKVAPAIDEMEAHVRSSGFIRNAVDVFADSNEAFKAVGLAIGTLAAAGFVGFSTLTATAAAGPTLLKMVMRSVRAREDVRRNRAYFVHALSNSKAVRRARKTASNDG